MEITSSPQTNRRTLRPWMLWIVVPGVILAAAVGWLAASELRARQNVQAELQRLRKAGVATSNAEIAKKFASETSQEHTQQWSNILTAIDNRWTSELATDLPFVGSPINQQTWDEVYKPLNASKLARAEEYLRWMQPLIEAVRDIPETPQPTWYPIHFDGWQTLLEPIQQANSLGNLLALETQVAIELGDGPRTMQGIETMVKTVEAFRWEIFQITDYYSQASAQRYRLMIRRSLAKGFWTPEQLERLETFIGNPTSAAEAWTKGIQNESGVLLASLNSSDDRIRFSLSQSKQWFLRLTSLPSIQLSLLRRNSELEDLATDNLARLLIDARAFDKRATSLQGGMDYLLNWYQPSNAIGGQFHAEWMARSEDDRRFTLLALAIERFHLQQGRFPSDLGELRETLELPPQVFQTVESRTFGYANEGDASYLWTYSVTVGGKVPVIPEERPQVNNITVHCFASK